MILIDGSMGEGGGQILRTAVALSALTLKPIKVYNIRAKRSNPGLRPQHIMAIRAVAQLSNAEVEGLKVGSSTIVFRPKRLRGGTFNFDIGTAGSISLVLQALLPVMAFVGGEVEVTIRGGTDVSWSPPIDYMRYVLLPLLRSIGFEVSLQVKRRGHYPKGGGIVHVKSSGVSKLKPVNKLRRGELVLIKGRSHAVRLPSHVAKRQAAAAEDLLKASGVDVPIEIEIETYDPRRDPHLGPGSGIVLCAITEDECRLGGDSLGARGKPAEKVGREAASKLLEELKSGMAFDRHMGDMLIPYIALAEGRSRLGISQLTMHTWTSIKLTEMIIGARFSVQGNIGEKCTVECWGVGL
ncbi:MAG: RNA 3'-phosphate cyclase [Thermoprotei archaeon]|nr:MAG: RNA 3'-phosphate cyclase [Thermoprotei archaeon]